MPRRSSAAPGAVLLDRDRVERGLLLAPARATAALLLKIPEMSTGSPGESSMGISGQLES